jgi:hypothetical protein
MAWLAPPVERPTRYPVAPSDGFQLRSAVESAVEAASPPGGARCTTKVAAAVCAIEPETP